MSLIDDIKKETNNIIRKVSWSIRWRNFKKACDEITTALLSMTLILIGLSPVFLWLLFYYAIFHFIVKYW